MKLFGRQKKTEEIPAELQPYYDGNAKSQKQGSGKLWLAIVGVIAAGVLAWLIYTLVSGGSGSAPASSAHNGQSQNGNKQQANNGNNSSSSSNSGDNNGSQAKPPQENASGNPGSSSESQESPSSNKPQQMVNTGPGDTLALFVGVTFMGALSFHTLQRRVYKAKNNG